MKRILTFAVAIMALAVFAEDSSDRFVMDAPSDGGIFPLFGRSIPYTDTLTGKKGSINSRTIYSRLKDYHHPCVKRGAVKTVSGKEIQKWINSRFAWKTKLKSFESPIQIKYKKRLFSLEQDAASVAAEYFCYEKKSDFSSIVAEIKEFYSVDFDMKWEDLSVDRSYRKEFDAKMSSIEDAIHAKLDVLDSIHKREFDAWRLENSTEYAKRAKQLEDEARHRDLSLQLELARHEVRATREEAEKAKEAAKAAEIRAAIAEQAASAAEQAATDAACETYRLRRRIDPRFPHDANE